MKLLFYRRRYRFPVSYQSVKDTLFRQDQEQRKNTHVLLLFCLSPSCIHLSALLRAPLIFLIREGGNASCFWCSIHFFRPPG